MSWQKPSWLPRLLAMPLPEPREQAARILAVQRNIVLPARGVVTAIAFYYLFFAHWLDQTFLFETLQQYFIFYIVFNALTSILLVLRRFPAHLVQWVVFFIGFLDGLLLAGLTMETGGFGSELFWVFPGLIVLNALSIPLATPQLVLNLALSLFYVGAGLWEAGLPEVAAVPQEPVRRTVRTGPAGEILDLPPLIAKLREPTNALSRFLWNQLSVTMRQNLADFTVTNATTRGLQFSLQAELNDLAHKTNLYEESRFAGIKLSEPIRAALPGLDLKGEQITRFNWSLLTNAFPGELVMRPPPKPPLEQMKKQATPAEETNTEPYVLRLIILWLLTASCYGVQLLMFRDRQAEREAREAAARNSELKTAGRLAAEIAHQLKNPLGIINNAAFSVQRGLREGRRDLAPQLEIIREEIERSDRIITQLMGYAQLCEGRVEKLSVPDELDRAIAEVFPPAAHYPVQIHRDYGPVPTTLTMQRSHLAVVLVNLLQNAREALNGPGNVWISTHAEGENGIEIVIVDDGPGIPAENLNRIFEAYFTSKERGTGLGLAIVKHNVELYGGTIRAESKLGKGARFVLLFPARIFAS